MSCSSVGSNGGWVPVGVRPVHTVQLYIGQSDILSQSEEVNTIQGLCASPLTYVYRIEW